MSLPKPPLSWRILDLLKVQSSPKQSRNSSQINLSSQTKDVHKCACCGLIVVFHEGATKFRCSQCNTTNMLVDFETLPCLLPETLISFAVVKALTDQCLAGPKPRSSHEMHLRLKPLVAYLLATFGSLQNINSIFKLTKPSSRARYSSCNLDLVDFHRTLDFLTRLPSKRPLFCLLSAIQHAIKHLPLNLVGNAKNLYWVVLIMEIPFLHRALTSSHPKSITEPRSMAEMPEIKSLCYDILKRVIGVLSQAESGGAGNYLASWFLNLSNSDFQSKVDLLNLYITFHLKRCFYLANNPELLRRLSVSETAPAADMLTKGAPNQRQRPSQQEDDEYNRFNVVKGEVEESSDSSFSWPHLRVSGNDNKRGTPQGTKIRTFHYTLNYHLKTATAALGILVKANYIRNDQHKLPVYSFYNSLVDFVNVKLDFDNWLSKKRAPKNMSKSEPPVQSVIDYINGTSSLLDIDSDSKPGGFFFCQYPYLISLGAKISILQYEARRQMERKAEEAFINSLDKRVVMDVYFKVRVRRDFIVQDSLQCIRLNQNNLKKGIKVQFLNEPGIDAGGLKKEWFLLLTRALFSPSTGMLHEVEDSNYLWFNIIPVNNLEIYYLFGAVLGLAIYNSTILDLAFPLAIYKILLGLPLGLADYKEIFPESANNLFKLRNYSAEELKAIDLTFEVSFHDSFGKLQERNLVPDGHKTPVTIDNREIYIDKYTHFFVSDGIKHQVLAFKNGFSSIVDGNAFSLFLPEEIQLLLCGSDQGKIDLDILESVTQYNGWKTKEEAIKSQVVQWFWKHLKLLDGNELKRVLLFITGSDRIPATGIENLTLKLTRLSNGKDSDRLPVAHTCFNELALYEYADEQKFVHKFTQAVTMLSGFGIK